MQSVIENIFNQAPIQTGATGPPRSIQAAAWIENKVIPISHSIKLNNSNIEAISVPEELTHDKHGLKTSDKARGLRT